MDKLFVVAGSYDDVSIFGSEGLDQKQNSVIDELGLVCLDMEASQVVAESRRPGLRAEQHLT